MKKAIELYGEDESYYSYQPIVESFGDILLQEKDEGWQGSTWVLYKDGNKIGFLRFGWGSCSGCDALQACYSINDVQELVDHLWQSMMWFDSKTEALKFFTEHDWEGDWDATIDEAQQFIKKAIELLSQ